MTDIKKSTVFKKNIWAFQETPWSGQFDRWRGSTEFETWVGMYVSTVRDLNWVGLLALLVRTGSGPLDTLLKFQTVWITLSNQAFTSIMHFTCGSIQTYLFGHGTASRRRRSCCSTDPLSRCCFPCTVKKLHSHIQKKESAFYSKMVQLHTMKKCGTSCIQKIASDSCPNF